MNIPTKKEMRWFVSKLIDIRNDKERTPDHIVDIEFDCEDIIKQKPIFGEIDKSTAENKIEEMLYRIKNDGEFLDKFNHFDEKRLSWEILDDDIIEIKGFQIGLLKEYRKENIFAGEKLFTLTVNTEGKTIISMYGEDTNVPLESEDQRRLFYYLLKHPNKFISYPSLFKEITKGRTHDSDYYSNLYPTILQQNTFVSNTVYNLKRKLDVLCQKYDIDIDKVLETMPKKGYKYHQ